MVPGNTNTWYLGTQNASQWPKSKTLSGINYQLSGMTEKGKMVQTWELWRSRFSVLRRVEVSQERSQLACPSIAPGK